MKPTDLQKGDILRAPNGELWNVEYVFPEKIVVVRREDVFELAGWEKVDAYTLTGKKPA